NRSTCSAGRCDAATGTREPEDESIQSGLSRPPSLDPLAASRFLQGIHTMIKDFLDEYHRYRVIGDKALAQVADEALNQIISEDNNSIAIIVRHVSGNLRSRFTDFLTSDGEKPWRDRDAEFSDATYDRERVEGMWAEGFQVVETALSALTDADLGRQITIRGIPHTVHEALCRSIAH